MSRLLRVRKDILGVTQSEIASITGATQATVSRWEKGELEPDRRQLDAIRTEAQRRGIAWDDRWFFEAPAEDAA